MVRKTKAAKPAKGPQRMLPAIEAADGVTVPERGDENSISLSQTSAAIDSIKLDDCAEIRTTVDEEADEALENSISAFGILEPLLVRELGEDASGLTYGLIGGHRRLAAARRLGMLSVPIRVVDDQRIAVTLGERLGRKRLDAQMGARFVGAVDNIARSDLSEADLLKFLFWLVHQADKSDRYLKKGRIVVATLAKDLGTGYQWLRARALVLERFTESEIAALSAKITQEGPDGQLSWSKVHHALRSGSDEAVAVIRNVVWPDQKAGQSPELETGVPSESDAAAGGSAPQGAASMEIRSRVRFDTFASEGMQIKFVGVPGKRPIQAEVTFRLPLRKRTFMGTSGDETFASLMADAAERAILWAKRGTGKDKENADLRVEALSACDQAVHSLIGKIGTSKSADD